MTNELEKRPRVQILFDNIDSFIEGKIPKENILALVQILIDDLNISKGLIPKENKNPENLEIAQDISLSIDEYLLILNKVAENINSDNFEALIKQKKEISEIDEYFYQNYRKLIEFCEGKGISLIGKSGTPFDDIDDSSKIPLILGLKDMLSRCCKNEEYLPFLYEAIEKIEANLKKSLSDAVNFASSNTLAQLELEKLKASIALINKSIENLQIMDAYIKNSNSWEDINEIFKEFAELISKNNRILT